ncbi:MAG: homocysteine S-methyltransferase family protein [Pseudomonadota bacterium]
MYSARYDSLFERIKNGERILIDGATGTECERRGVPQVMNTWNSGAALSHPDIVRNIHEDYIECGAEIIITNTFSSSRHAMRSAGIEDRFEALTNAAIQLAQEARENKGNSKILIAGGITHWIWTEDKPSLAELEVNSREQANLMAAGGCDLIMLEMLIDIDRLLACIDGTQSSGLPVWAGISLEPKDGKMCLLNGESLEDTLDAIRDKDIPLLNIMHTEVDHIDAALDIVEARWEGAVGVYAHTCKFSENDTKAIFDDTISPGDYAKAAQRWLDRGVQVIGGCCGVRKEHICALQKVL